MTFHPNGGLLDNHGGPIDRHLPSERLPGSTSRLPGTTRLPRPPGSSNIPRVPVRHRAGSRSNNQLSLGFALLGPYAFNSGAFNSAAYNFGAYDYASPFRAYGYENPMAPYASAYYPTPNEQGYRTMCDRSYDQLTNGTWGNFGGRSMDASSLLAFAAGAMLISSISQLLPSSGAYGQWY